MTPCEFAAIQARANSADDSRGAIQRADIYRIEVPSSFFDRISASQRDVRDLLAAVRERDNTIARVREVGLLGLEEIAQKSIDATVARMQDQLGCTPDDLGPYVMAKIVDSHIEQAELFAGPVLDALRAALDPQETP